MLKIYKEGTHRAVGPGETLARIRPLLGRMGITRLANVMGLDTIGIPVAQAVRLNAKSLSVAQGKGANLECALVSAAMESIESYHAEQISGPVRVASYTEMRRKFCVADPYRLRHSRRIDHPCSPKVDHQPAPSALPVEADRRVSWQVRGNAGLRAAALGWWMARGEQVGAMGMVEASEGFCERNGLGDKAAMEAWLAGNHCRREDLDGLIAARPRAARAEERAGGELEVVLLQYLRWSGEYQRYL